MKKILRLFLFNLGALWAVSSFLPGVKISGGFSSFLTAAVILTAVNLLVKPLVNLLLLPLNLITLGMFRWLGNVIALYLVTVLAPQLKIVGFWFLGFTYQGFQIPKMYLNSFWVYVLTSFFISLITSFLLWLT